MIRVKIKKKIESAVIHKVSKRTYNVIRSFVESSSKERYHWNIGIKVNNVVRFVKEGRWALEVASLEVPIERGVGAVVAHLSGVVKIIAMPTEERRAQLLMEVKGVDKRFDINDALELRKHYVVADTLFAYPISLHDVLMKMLEYVEFEFEAEEPTAQQEQ